MKPFLCFLGGCEFEYIIHELKSNPELYLDFDYFYSFQHRGQTNPFNFIADNFQEVIDCNPDAIFLSQHDFMMGPITNIQLNRISSREQQEEKLKELVDQCELMIINLLQLNVPIILQFFPWFRTNMSNRFKHTAPFYNEEQFMRKYVTAMEELTVRYPNFYLLNLTNVCSMHGFKHTLKQADAPWYSHIQFPAKHIAQEYTYFIDYVLRRNKKVKCLIVDLDNTMWKGVIRDIGVENLEIRIDKERFHWNVLAILYARGILIGVISKNDAYLEDEIQAFIKEHLAGTKFVCFRLSWEDKWKNLQEVQQQLNIGLDSIAFIDDSPFEREQMKAMLPEVRVYDENIFEKLLYMPEFQPEFVTQESRKRSEFYIQENQRQQAKSNAVPEDFLKQCNFSINIEKMRPFQVDRVCELIQRTNQLNTSIKRYTKEQIISMSHEQNVDIFTVTVSDKFGDYGLVGVCIGLHNDNTYEIDTMLFSCRIMSRGVEDYTITSILNHAKSNQFEKAVLRFEKGPKNEQMKTILSNNGFVESAQQGNSVIYSFNLQQQQVKSLPEWFSSNQSETQSPLSVSQI